MLNLNHLYYFCVSAENKTITNASKILSISQPALSTQIKLLETQIGCKLFRKSGRNVFLSLEGEKLYRLCKPIFESLSDLERRMQNASPLASLQLRIGFTEQIEGVFVEELVSQILSFKKWDHRPKLQVTCGKKEALVNQLKAHEIDLAFSNTSTADPEIIVVQKFQMPVGLYISTRERNKFPNKVRRDFLTDPDFGLVLPNPQLRLRHEIDEFLEQKKIKKPVYFESDTLALVTRAVIDHVGMGFFPKPYLQDEEKLKRVICLSGPTPLWHHSLYVLSHLRFEQTPAIQEMILTIRKHFSIVEHAKTTK